MSRNYPTSELLTRKPARVDGRTWYFGLNEDLDADWARQQEESIARYLDPSYEEDDTTARIFGGFMATTIDRGAVILDIGCGLHGIIPPYVAELGLQNYLGIEPLTTPVQREYDCLAGVLAEDLPLADNAAGAAIFSTSLDHIEKANEAICDTVRVLKPGAPLYFWLGVHDAETLAYRKSFANMHILSSGWRRWARILGSPIEHLHLMRQMRQRHIDLRRRKALDHAHVRYHVAAGIDREMESYGLRIERRLYLPERGSLMVEAKMI